MGDGWWAGKVGLAPKGQYGTELAVVARLRVTYTDGTSQWFDTGPDWSWAPGPFVATDLQIGENYDARWERPGWSTPGDPGAGWSPVQVVASDTAKLAPQPDEPVRETEVLDTVEVTTPEPGVTVYDVGQNMVGVSRVTMTGQAGQTVKIRHAEVLNPDGTLYTENLRAALSTDYYTFADDGTITYQPTFTQHGFRYIEISGLDTAPGAADVKGVVWGSDLTHTGTLETSNGLVNQLMSNVRWGARGNFLSIPTDTPARDERLGWTGDINVFAPTASYLFDMRAFLDKWMTDVRDEQKPDGQIPAVVPSTNGAFDESGPGWQDAIVTVPYALYRAYDDLSLVRRNWPAMLKFYDFAKGRIGEDNLGAYASTFFTGDDWLSLEPTTGASNEVKSTAIWADTARMMAELAIALDDPRADELTDRYAQIKRDFVAAYVSADGTIAGGAQTVYALTLGMGLIDDEDLRAKVGEKYVAKLALTDNHLTTGFIGTPHLLPALSAIGRDDLAYEILLREDYPSWGYEISKGATTVWERWNSIQPDGSFGPVDMNSFNHYAYGAVADWMHRYIGGIRIDEPGYRTSIIEPRPGGGITEASGAIDTVYGRLASAWELTETGIRLDVTVPVNTTSTVRLPSTSPAIVTESGAPVAEAVGVESVTQAGTDVTEVVVGSGDYSFLVANPVTIDAVSVEHTDPGVDTLLITVTNHGDRAVQGQASAGVVAEWTTVPSALTRLEAGATHTYRIPVIHPLDAPAGDYSVPVEFTDRGRVAAAAQARIIVAAPTVPPVEDVSDHVDFGESDSEAAHGVQASPTSGTSVEAGYTRRYSHNNTPGSWYSAQIEVEPGAPFLLRMRETWNSAGTKDYEVLVDDVLVEHVRLSRTAGGQGTSEHQILVADPTVLDHDGAVTVTFRYPESNAPLEYYDPSIADLWVIPTPDEAAPLVSAAPAPDAVFTDGGGFEGPVPIVITAADVLDAQPRIEYSLDGGPWAVYDGPVLVAGAGDHQLRYRASDRFENTSDTRELTVRIEDGTPVVRPEVATATRCVAGRVVLVVTVTNGDDVPMSAEVSTDFGSRTIASLEAGRGASVAFSSRATAVSAGSVTVQASAEIDGETATGEQTIGYEAASCR